MMLRIEDFFLLMVSTAAFSTHSIDRDGNALTQPFSIIGDQDSKSKIGNAWYSPMLIGNLLLDVKRMKAIITWITKHNYTSKLNYGGRGMEMSDLKYFNSRLLSVDDKTGVIYWIQGRNAIPWAILADGDGTVPTPFKGEWLAVKGEHLYCGSTGTEATTFAGEQVIGTRMFVKKISMDGIVSSESWANSYNKLRAAICIHYPGYIIHEAVQWSNVHKRWFLLPRHMSKEALNTDKSGKTGASVLLSADENFSGILAKQIGQEKLIRGFSAFQFVPGFSSSFTGTNDSVILALKSQELVGEPFASYIMVFTVEGKIILDETKIPGQDKYEGVEFLHLEDFKTLV